MSNTMLLGVLRMPVNEDDPLCIAQFVQRARQAADRIESDAAEIARLQSEVERLQADNDHQRGRRNAARKCIKDMGEGSAWLLRKQAEAIEDWLHGDADMGGLDDYAQRLRQQAAEIEGGDDDKP